MERLYQFLTIVLAILTAEFILSYLHKGNNNAL